ncbi:tRNA uridine(34) 5-carboxymethylaminomethyl modification radical SAM/GNAT enzyme Elp3 [Candidatus Dojkabacteria bacterium]|uniref:tRNA carboxymethyluridine synthase n=1 Tax=Candidatus Dojkabacteria bacterium TaxID=2099670 RepID=A0A955RJ50_9BACT|nr:tRNA uridine(34) 5-carboxymethylaminomethyl modification radical SAM/GNAT enzyme Elp3 [Candidatus Dojkabacteria bacterium]
MQKPKKNYNFDPEPYRETLLKVIDEVEAAKKWSQKRFQKILYKYPKDGNAIFSKDQVVRGYKLFVKEGIKEFRQDILDRIKMKPVRTISGVTPVTVLTKPFPCPGKCIYCPNDVRMPKSYLKDEPGAQRAERNNFDPYLQTYNRLLAFQNNGHNIDKVELIILGGTWSFYPDEYQIWFLKRCFEAMNDFGKNDQRDVIATQNLFEEADKVPNQTKEGRKRSYNELVTSVVRDKGKEFFTKSELSTWEELEEQQRLNEKAKARCVGLVIETRPDYIDEKEVIKIRRLGATKVQIGVQSLDDKIQELNKRGHGKQETAKAFKLLRLAGFKIHAHWMPNQYGATVKGDIADFKRLWGEEFIPDELKIYPTSIIANTKLNDLYQKGEYEPYSYDDLLKVLTDTMSTTPRYCRLTRVIRDIPSTDIVAGNKLTNFRQIAENKLKQEGRYCQCIRCREIKGQEVTEDELELEVIEYATSGGIEKFISYKTKSDDKIVGFCRLSLPYKDLSKDNFIEELKDKAIIREVHVYGQVVQIGKRTQGRSQHLGLGTKLVQEAEQIAKESGYEHIAVISAIGTRDYYRKLGFKLDHLYMVK